MSSVVTMPVDQYTFIGVYYYQVYGPRIAQKAMVCSKALSNSNITCENQAVSCLNVSCLNALRSQLKYTTGCSLATMLNLPVVMLH